MNYTLKEIIYSILNEIKDLYYEDIKNKIEETYNNQLINLKNSIKKSLEKRFTETLTFLNSQYNATYNYYMNKSQIGNYTIDKLNSETKETIVLSFKNLMEKVKKYITKKQLKNLSIIFKKKNYQI